ncbi:unnamed protein product [Symbiodinium sp. CCMP2456]|nr:unnamed protein product [Symbiodinium sp. CCMP2456]
MAMKPSTMPVAERMNSILCGVEELKKRALKGTEFEDEKAQEDPNTAKEADAVPKSKPAPVKHEAATPKARASVCKTEHRSPGVPSAGVADVQGGAASEADVPATMTTSPVATSRQSTPKSSRRKRRSSRTPKDKTPEAKPTMTQNETPEEKPRSRTPEHKTAEKPSRTPKDKTPEEKPSRTPKADKTPEQKPSRTPKEKTPEEKPSRTPQKDAPEEEPRSRTPKDKAPAAGTPKAKAPEETNSRTPKDKAPVKPGTPKSRTPCSGKRRRSTSPAAAQEATSLGAWSVNSSGTWVSDGSCDRSSEGWGWDDKSSWGSSWDYTSSWSNDHWGNSWGWGSRGSNWSWKDWGTEANDPSSSDHESARVQSLLMRGHTIDQLSLDELKFIVTHVDSQQQKKAAEEAAGKPQDESKQDERKQDEPKQEESKQEDADNDEKASDEKVAETKEQRRKRLHARNMRFYRSFESPNCPKEIKKLASKASGDSSKRSFLFENWLTSSESWMKSSLLQRLKSKNSNAKRGLRRWLTKQEMVAKWGEEIAQAMIETKENDDEKAMTEIRAHPELPLREDYCIVSSCISLYNI